MERYGDIILIKISVIIAVIGMFVQIIIMMRNRQKYNSYKDAIQYLFVGLLTLVIWTIWNSAELGRWDKESVFSFLALIEFTKSEPFPGDVVLRLSALISYLFISLGLANFVIVKFNRYKE